MSTILKNILAFSNLQIGVPVSLPHGLNLSDLKLAPQLVGADAGGFTLAADDTNVTATRTAAALSGDVHVYVEHWHTIEEVLPLPGKLVGLTPFILASGGGAGDGPLFASARVNPDGTTICFHACAVSQTGQGQYHVDFTPPFLNNVAVVAQINQDSTNGMQIAVINVTNAGFDVTTRENSDGWLFTDMLWSFNALPSETPLLIEEQ